MSDLQQFAFVGLGSNLGDSAASIRRAMDRLQEFSTVPLLRSSLWKSTPVDCPPGSPSFINGVVGLLPRASETPLSLLRKLFEIEREFGRKPKQVLNEPRPLDLDLLAFARQQSASSELTLPHPRLHLRKFVLAPLNELAPDLVFPGMNRTISELLSALPPEQLAERIS